MESISSFYIFVSSGDWIQLPGLHSFQFNLVIITQRALDKDILTKTTVVCSWVSIYWLLKNNRTFTAQCLVRNLTKCAWDSKTKDKGMWRMWEGMCVFVCVCVVYTLHIPVHTCDYDVDVHLLMCMGKSQRTPSISLHFPLRWVCMEVSCSQLSMPMSYSCVLPLILP